MHSGAWHIVTAVTAAFIIAAFVLLPLMGKTTAQSMHAGEHHAAMCSDGYQSSTTGDHHLLMQDGASKDDCGHVPVQKSNCCPGAFCPSVQMVALASVDLPIPGVTLGIRQPISSATGHGLHPAPSPKPPRLAI